MSPFPVVPYQIVPYAPTQRFENNPRLVDLMVRSGEDQANAIRQQGAASENVWNQVGQGIQSTIQNTVNAAQTAQQNQIKTGFEKTQAADAALKLAQNQKAVTEGNVFKQTLQSTPLVNLGDGTMGHDVQAIAQQLTAQGVDPSTYVPHIDELNKSFQQVTQAHAALLQTAAQKLIQGGNDPTLGHIVIDQLVANKVIDAPTAQQYRAFIDADPGNLAKLTASLAGPQKIEKFGPGDVGINVNNPSAPPVISVPAKPLEVTEATLDAAAQALLTKQNSGQPLTGAEAASLKAYQDRKRTVSDPAAIAAATRQTTAIDAATAQQKRTQDFAIMKEGKDQLTKVAEVPYQTALSSAQTMRDTVAAAQAGNKVAGSLQSLETTMAAIRAQGLNRINTAEIGVTANAGNLWDHLVGWVGKAEAGQPVPADIQKDMTQFADILEKAAYQKYITAHQSITKRYNLTDEAPLPAPSAAAPAQPSTSAVNPFR